MRIRGAKSIANPSLVLFGAWAALLLLLLVGPIKYPGQPSLGALIGIVCGCAVFLAGHIAGALLARFFPSALVAGYVPPARAIDNVMIVTSLLGIGGILLIAFDRQVLSGLDNANYAAALRCAPEFIDVIGIRRTPLIYIGYMIFSFGFASVALFMLRAEHVRGWASYLAQASIISPVGYAVLYSGRMPILLMLTLLFTVAVVRLSKGQSFLPGGHFLLLKSLVFVVAFGVYVNAMWTSRQNFCAQIQPVISQLREVVAQKKAKEYALSKANPDAAGKGLDGSNKISAQDFAALIQNRLQPTEPLSGESTQPVSAQHLFEVMKEAWGVAPRSYVGEILDRNWLSPSKTISVMSNYFYLTHGVMTLDRIVTARANLDPTWGVYEIGVLSPMIRVFFPGSPILNNMADQLSEAKIYGFFPTVWGAAIVDFKIPGAIFYIFIWGALGGWCYALSRRTELVTPRMGLAFVLASVLLSPIQGPLGVANSALVLISMIATGLLIDFGGRVRD